MSKLDYELKQIFNLFCRKWNKSLSNEEKKGYKETIEDFDTEELEAVTDRFMEEYKSGERTYFPRPLDFEKKVKQYKKEKKNKQAYAKYKEKKERGEHCQACDDTGLIPVLCIKNDQAVPYYYIAYCRCSCTAAMSVSPNIPEYSEMFRTFQFKGWQDSDYHTYHEYFEEKAEKFLEKNKENIEEEQREVEKALF